MSEEREFYDLESDVIRQRDLNLGYYVLPYSEDPSELQRMYDRGNEALVREWRREMIGGH